MDQPDLRNVEAHTIDATSVLIPKMVGSDRLKFPKNAKRLLSAIDRAEDSYYSPQLGGPRINDDRRTLTMLKEAKYKFEAANAYADAKSHRLEASFTTYHNKLIGTTETIVDNDGANNQDAHSIPSEVSRRPCKMSITVSEESTMVSRASKVKQDSWMMMYRWELKQEEGKPTMTRATK